VAMLSEMMNISVNVVWNDEYKCQCCLKWWI